MFSLHCGVYFITLDTLLSTDVLLPILIHPKITDTDTIAISPRGPPSPTPQGVEGPLRKVPWKFERNRIEGRDTKLISPDPTIWAKTVFFA